MADWADRWQGGLCPAGALGGQPIRGADYAASRPFAEQLRLVGPAISLAERAATTDAWSRALGAPVVLARSVDAARAAMLTALRVAPGDSIALPANATRALVEAVKQHRARPRFLPLQSDLSLAGPAGVPAWAQPIAGLRAPLPGSAAIVDQADLLPPVAPPSALAFGKAAHRPRPAAALYGLHLSSTPSEAGALVAFGDRDLARRVLADPPDGPDPPRAMAQLIRLAGTHGLAARQRAAIAATWHAVAEAAGLELVPLSTELALGVALRVPEECDPATFLAYVRGENTPIQHLPELRPVHYAAVHDRHLQPTANHLSRFVLVPVSPDQTADELAHAVLGIVKAADYLGVRWRTDPARARRYAEEMTARYGPDHDAYRPLF